MQRSGPAPQFGLAKSFPGFGPTGPVLVTPGEFPDPDDLEIGCRLGDETLQLDRTSGMVFGVPALVGWLSHITPLFPGDLIFTGTPSGIGMSRHTWPARTKVSALRQTCCEQEGARRLAAIRRTARSARASTAACELAADDVIGP